MKFTFPLRQRRAAARSIRFSVYLKWIMIGVATLAGAGIVLVRDRIVPAYFEYDAAKIQRIALGEEVNDSKFAAVADFYRLFGMADRPELAGLFGLGLYIATTAAVLLALRRLDITWLFTVCASVGIILAGIYLGQYSKDVFVLPIVLLVLLLPKKWIADVAIAVCMLVYAWQMRDYWAIVTVAATVTWLTYRWVPRWWLPLVGVLITTVASLGIVYGLGRPADTFRNDVNTWRDLGDAGSIILPFFDLGEPISGILNNIAMFIFAMFPLPLATRGGAYYLAVAALIATIWAIAWLGMLRAKRGVLVRRATALLVGFASTQALFEPDWGSTLRHLTPLLPLILLLLMQMPREVRWPRFRLWSRRARANTSTAVPGPTTQP